MTFSPALSSFAILTVVLVLMLVVGMLLRVLVQREPRGLKPRGG